MRIPRILHPRAAVAALAAALVALAGGVRRLAGATTTLLVVAAVLVAAGTARGYSPPAPVEGAVARAEVIVQPSGAASITWTRYSEADRVWHPRAAIRVPEGQWAAADPGEVPPDATVSPWPPWTSGTGLDPLGDRVVARQFGDGAGGHAVAIWTVRLIEKDPVTGAIFERRQTRAQDRQPDGTWSAPHDVGPPDAGMEVLFPCACGPGPDWRPAVAVDATGGAVAAWTSRLAPPGGSIALWSARPAGGAWSAPAPLAVNAEALRLATTPSGETLAIWEQGGRLRWASRPAGGGFGPGGDLGPAGWSEAGWVLPSLSVDAGGRALVAWSGSRSQLLAATRTPGGAWSAPVDLTALEKPAPPKPPAVVEEPVVRAPLLAAVRLSRATLRRSSGTVLRFRLGSAGEVRVTVQRRGRGKGLRGLRVRVGAGEHRVRLFASRPLPPGRYTVRIRVTSEGQVPMAAAKRLLVLPPA